MPFDASIEDIEEFILPIRINKKDICFKLSLKGKFIGDVYIAVNSSTCFSTVLSYNLKKLKHRYVETIQCRSEQPSLAKSSRITSSSMVKQLEELLVNSRTLWPADNIQPPYFPMKVRGLPYSLTPIALI